MSRDLYVGDVHGCLEELKELLQTADYDPSTDRLTFVGDLVDRGPDSAGTVHFVRKLAARHPVVCVRGNHEHRYIRCYERLLAGESENILDDLLPGAKRTLFERFEDADLEWMAGLPLHHEVGGFRVVHGGIDRRHQVPGDLDRRRYRDRLFQLRTVDPVTLQMSREGVPWAARYDGRLGPVVYGHEPFDDVRIDPHAIGLDTSCCFGGKLSALIASGSDRRFISVPARRPYAPRRGPPRCS